MEVSFNILYIFLSKISPKLTKKGSKMLDRNCANRRWGLFCIDHAGFWTDNLPRRPSTGSFGPQIYLGDPQLALLGSKSNRKNFKVHIGTGKIAMGALAPPIFIFGLSSPQLFIWISQGSLWERFQSFKCSATTSSAYLACQPPRSLHNAVPNLGSSALPAPQFKSLTRSTG